MKSKTKNSLKKTLILIIGVLIAGGGMTKIIAIAPLVELYDKIGLLPYLRILGVVELILLGIYILPRTMKVGFLLLTGYFGGAMAVELSHGTFFIAPAMILSLIWASAYLRDASIFVSAAKSSFHAKPVAI